MRLEEIVCDVIYSILKQENKVTREMITREKSLIDDLSADSLSLLEIVQAFEKKFNIAVDIFEARDRLNTVSDIILFLEEELSALGISYN